MTYLQVRNHSSRVTPMAVGVATGVTGNGQREILGLDIGEQRGLTGVKLVTSDQHSGLVAALRRRLQCVAHQRCRVYIARNLLAHVPKAQADYVAAAFRTISAQSSPPSPHAH